MLPSVISVNVARPQPDPGGEERLSGIDKWPVGRVEVTAEGVRGDVVVSRMRHGGGHRAVYAYAREELLMWQERLGRRLVDGYFGENLTTVGMDLAALLINQRVRLGTAVLEVSGPRIPSRTFAHWMRLPDDWVDMFSDRGDPGAYFRVITPGLVGPGDVFEFFAAPGHGITVGGVFRALRGDAEAARKMVAARVLPPDYEETWRRGQLF